MSGLTPNTSNISLVAKPITDAVRMITHPEYQYWRSDWQKLRDVLAGEREIKRKGETYLPKMKGADTEDYALYLQRATFYNMTAQTLNGMLGQVFRRDPTVRGLPDKFKNAIRKFAKDGTGLFPFTKTTMSEQIGIGRFGVLVDIPDTPTRKAPNSFAVGYTAENILDWTVEDVDGAYVPTRVLVREFVRDTDYIESAAQENLTTAEARQKRFRQKVRGDFGGPSPSVTPSPNYTSAYIYITIFREFVLEDQPDGTRVYRQYVYKDDPTRTPLEIITPTVRGQTLDFIPFMFFGSTANSADTEKPTLLDICDLNLAHYMTYAELEWGRMFTALPVYYAPGNDSEGAGTYHIGPNLVWEVPQGSTPGIIEYTGQGLKALETALATKEAQIAAIGGRLMPGNAKSVSESDNQTALREANEQSLLLSVIQAAENGLTTVIRWWLMWRDVPMAETEGLRLEINQDFLMAPIGAREIRAIQMLYADGIIPVDTLYEYLRKAQVIASDLSLDQFKALLDDPNSFINAPDAQARQRGFADRGQELNQAIAAREADIAERKAETGERAVVVEEEKLAIAQKVGSTSVAATRKLGDPEQAKPAIADAATIKIAAAKQKADAKKPAPAPGGFGAPRPPAAPTPAPRKPPA